MSVKLELTADIYNCGEEYVIEVNGQPVHRVRKHDDGEGQYDFDALEAWAIAEIEALFAFMGISK